MEQQDCDEFRTLFKIHDERSQNCHSFWKTLSQQKHVVLHSTAPLQLKCFKVGSKMVKAASAPVLPNQKKKCCKIARFTDAPYFCQLTIIRPSLHNSKTGVCGANSIHATDSRFCKDGLTVVNCPKQVTIKIK